MTKVGTIISMLDLIEGRAPSMLPSIMSAIIEIIEEVAVVQGVPKYYVTGVSSSLNNFHIMDNLIFFQRKFPKQDIPII